MKTKTFVRILIIAFAMILSLIESANATITPYTWDVNYAVPTSLDKFTTSSFSYSYDSKNYLFGPWNTRYLFLKRGATDAYWFSGDYYMEFTANIVYASSGGDGTGSVNLYLSYDNTTVGGSYTSANAKNTFLQYTPTTGKLVLVQKENNVTLYSETVELGRTLTDMTFRVYKEAGKIDIYVYSGSSKWHPFRAVSLTVPAGEVGLSSTYSGNAKVLALTMKNLLDAPAKPVDYLSFSKSTLTGFTYKVDAAGPSTEQSFTLSGASLTGDITVTPPSNFEISTTSGSGFSTNPITLTQTAGVVDATPVYVRLKSGLAVASYSQNIVISTTGVSSENVVCAGSVSSLPTLDVTTAASAINSTTATSGGNVTLSGSTAVTARGVCWKTLTGPTTSNSKTSDGTGTGVFTSNLTGLTAGTTYYVRAYATNSGGTEYGAETSFTTTGTGLSTIAATTAVTAISQNTATSGGIVISDGSSPITSRGVCWKTSTGPTISNSKTTETGTIGTFTSTLTGLSASTTYYVKAYATNANGTAYGPEVSFTTAKIEPTNQPTNLAVGTVTTSAIPLIWTAAATGSQLPDGYLVKLSTTAVVDPVDGTDPADITAIFNGMANKKVTTGTSTSASSFTGMVAGTMYNYKVYSYTNSGSSINFKTISVPTLSYATLPNAVTTATFTATTPSTASIGWITASGYNTANHSTLVFVKEGSAITAGTPNTTPSTYTANSAIGLGTAYQADADAKCVYNGDGTNVTISGLNANSTYYVLIYTVVDASNSNSTNSYSAAVTQNAIFSPKALQTITFDALPDKVKDDASFGLNGSASSGLPVSYTSSNTSVATVSGSTVTIVGGGSTVITASQAGDASYYPATNVEQTLTVKYVITANPNNPSLGSVTGAANYNGGANVTLTATPVSGYKFLNWTENNQEVSTNVSYSFNATANKTLVANFVELYYTPNLIVNSSFEQSSGIFYNHGAYSTTGWTGDNYTYSGCGFRTGGASNGNVKLDLSSGGSIQTDDASLIPVTPGYLYKFSFDLQTYICLKPTTFLGTFGYVYFLDGSNNVIKTEFTQSQQDDGVYPWQTISLYVVAPAGAAKARVKIDASIGTYGTNEASRSVYVDNCKFAYVAEDVDRLMIRNAPKMVEPGKSYKVILRYATIGDENLTLQLMKGNQAYGEVNQSVTAGRGLLELNYTVPVDAPSGDDFAWKVSLPGKTISNTGVFIDQTEIGSGTVDADNPNIIITGRIDQTNPKAPVMYWFGSEIKTRFNGTSISIKYSTTPSGYGGYLDEKINYVIDENETDIRTLVLNGSNKTDVLVTGLSNTTHTIRIMKWSESAEGYIVFKGFVLDSGKGLLKPDVAGDKKIEIYGNSVTSGGGADYGYLGYAPTLARAMHFEPHIISKGGTGVASSFSGMVTQLDYWDKLDFINAFNVSACRKWDFSTWQADVIFVGTGHNDQFNDGYKTFNERYRTLLTILEAKYPNAHIFCAVPLISNPYSMLATVIKPMLKDHPRIHFKSQLFTDASVWSHPSPPAHLAMVYGDATRWSTAEWIEETMGWGIGLPYSVESVSVSPANATITDNATQLLTATINPTSAIIKDVLWISSDTTIAKVNSVGLVTGVSKGTATITAISVDGGRIASSKIAVNSTVSSVDFSTDNSLTQLYPNPLLNGLLNISTKGDAGTKKLKVFDISGRIVFEKTLDGGECYKIDLSKIASKGIYLIKLYSSKGESSSKLCIQ